MFVNVLTETQPDQVCLRRTLRETTRFHRQSPRNRSQPEEDQCHHGNERSCNNQGCAEAYRLHGVLGQIPFQTWRTGIILLQAPKATRQVLVDP